MRKTLAYCLFLGLFACSSSNESSTFDSDKLQGKYIIDISPFVQEAVKKEDNEAIKLLAGLVYSSLEVEIDFYENNKGLCVIDGYYLKLVNAITERSLDSRFIFDYKVEADNILYVKEEGKEEFEKVGKINLLGGHYDYIELIVQGADGGPNLNLKKVQR